MPNNNNLFDSLGYDDDLDLFQDKTINERPSQTIRDAIDIQATIVDTMIDHNDLDIDTTTDDQISDNEKRIETASKLLSYKRSYNF